MKKETMRQKFLAIITIILVCSACFFASGCGELGQEVVESLLDLENLNPAPVDLAEIPDYEGDPYVEVDGNTPGFTDEEITTEAFEIYRSLDWLGRCGSVYANVCQELMPTEPRGNISEIKPSGWHTKRYDFVDGESLYNRCHLIGFQLTGENANERNLITGTRYMNTEGMLPFEIMVADYVKETGNHVLYRVTPIYDGDDLVAKGVQMEGWSVEDQGEGICFNVFAYNVQPGVIIDYTTGDNWLDEEWDGKTGSQTGSQTSSQSDSQALGEGEIRGNSRSKVYHCPGQQAYEDMADSNHLVIFESEEEAEAAGYHKAKQ